MGSSISRFTTGVSRIRTGSGHEVQELPLAPIMLDFLNLPGSPKQNPVKRTGFTCTIVTFGLNADIIATPATIHDCPNRQGSRLFCSLLSPPLSSFLCLSHDHCDTRATIHDATMPHSLTTPRSTTRRLVHHATIHDATTVNDSHDSRLSAATTTTATPRSKIHDHD